MDHLNRITPCDKSGNDTKILIKKLSEPQNIPSAIFENITSNISSNISANKKIDSKKLEEYLDICKCIFCDKEFTRRDSVLYHIKHNCKKVKEINENDKQFDKMKNENKRLISSEIILKEENKYLKDIINDLIKKKKNLMNDIILKKDDESNSDSEINTNDIIKINPDRTIETINKDFDYDDNTFNYIIVKNKIYFDATDIIEYLKYDNIEEILKKNIRDKYKFTLDKLLNLNNKDNKIYISEIAICKLIYDSDKDDTEEFQDYIFDELIPSIQNKYFYKKSYRLFLETNFMKGFFDDNDICDYDELCVIYIGIIGLYNGEFLLKFGESTRVFDRDYKEHKKTFGEQFKMIFVLETDNNRKVEKLFKKAIKSKGLDLKLNFNGKPRNELFATNDDFSLDDAISLMKKLVLLNPTKSHKEKDSIIEKLKQKNDDCKEKEKTKQLELQLEILKMQEKLQK
jgi:hypothetical protein